MMLKWLTKKLSGTAGNLLFDSAFDRLQELSSSEQDAVAALIDAEMTEQQDLLSRKLQLRYVSQKDQYDYEEANAFLYQCRIDFYKYRMDNAQNEASHIDATMWWAIYTALRGGNGITAKNLLDRLTTWCLPRKKKDSDHDDQQVSREASGPLAPSAEPEASYSSASKWLTCSNCQTFFDPAVCPDGCPQCARSRQQTVAANAATVTQFIATSKKQRCKICNTDFALGYINSENICRYCATDLGNATPSKENAPVPEKPTAATNSATVQQSVAQPISQSRCKICKSDFASEHVNSENICIHCVSRIDQLLGAGTVARLLAKAKTQEDSVAQLEPAEPSAARTPKLPMDAVAPVTGVAVPAPVNKTLSNPSRQSEHVPVAAIPCVFPSCGSPSMKQLGEKHYCIDHLPFCDVSRCGNRALNVVNGHRRCNRHADYVAETIPDKPSKSDTTHPKAHPTLVPVPKPVPVPSPVPPPVENLRLVSLNQQLVQLGCTIDGSKVRLPDGTTKQTASTFDLEDLRDQLRGY